VATRSKVWVLSVVCECDRDSSIMRRPWPTRGSCAMVRGGDVGI